MRISEHALLRYCEHILGFDRIAASKAFLELLAGAKDGRHKLPGLDLLAVVKEGTVVTFIPYSIPKPPKPKPPKPPKVARPIPDQIESWLQ